MTEEDRALATHYAVKTSLTVHFGGGSLSFPASVENAFIAGRESMRAELSPELDSADGLAEIMLRQLDAERARAAKLIATLKGYASPFTYISDRIKSIADLQACAIDALREYEASRD